ncbi:hypothetical protein I4U23_006523 [Adineta vaga]|nr:hypothetical protein I4U23_006523 [Adineta vaga]
MCLQFQSRPWLCHILYTLSLHGSTKFLGTNSSMSLFIDEEKCPNGFYLIDNQKMKCQKKIEFISCSLLTYIYCYLKDNYYWLMGNEIDSTTNEKRIKVYYGNSLSLSTPLLSFQTDKFIPISHIDNIEHLYVIKHKLQLKTCSILGDLILCSKDYRILSCHNGIIIHEISMNNPFHSIFSYQTIENEQLFLFMNKDLQSIDIYQYNEDFTLNSFTNAHETGDHLLFDDFSQIGWKQILFLKNNFNFNDFILTDFSQIHVYQQESEYDYNIEEKHLSMDTDDVDVHHSLAIVQDILRKKIINADYIIHEGYVQCKQIENDIRKINQQNYIPNLNINTYPMQSNQLLISSSILQMTELNWFIYRRKMFVYVTIKNISKDDQLSVNLFGIDKYSNKIKIFDLKPTLQTLTNEQVTFRLNSNSSLTFILTTFIELDQNIDIELYLFINDNQKLYRVSTLIISLDDLINPNHERILNMNALEMEPIYHFKYRQALIYCSTLSRFDINIQSTSTIRFIEYFQQLLMNMGFKQLITIPNGYIRVNQGNIFEHAMIHFIEDNDLIVHFYAENLNEVQLLVKYILSKLDFQSFSLLNSNYIHSNDSIKNRFQCELTSYLDIFKQVPTIMRKVAPTTKSEAYRLLKMENFQAFQNERNLTDLLLASLIID